MSLLFTQRWPRQQNVAASTFFLLSVSFSKSFAYPFVTNRTNLYPHTTVLDAVVVIQNLILQTSHKASLPTMSSQLESGHMQGHMPSLKVHSSSLEIVHFNLSCYLQCLVAF